MEMATAVSEELNIPEEKVTVVVTSSEECQKLDLLKKAFTNAVVADKVISYLSFSDIKALSEVSRDFHKIVRGSKRFKEDAVLVVRSEKDDFTDTKNLKLGKLSDMNYDWRGFKVDLAVQVLRKDMNPNPKIPFLKSVEFLALVRMDPEKWFWPMLPHVMRQLLTSTPKLKHLEMDSCVFHKQNAKLNEIFLLPEVRENLKNLERLDIVERDFTRPTSTFEWKPWQRREPDDDMDSFLNLANLPMRLKSFRTNRMTTSWKFKEQHVKMVLKNNRETLEELCVDLSLWKMKDPCEIIFPKLKSLSVTVEDDETNQQRLAELLKNHPQLEELNIQTPEHRGDLHRFVLNAIQGMCANLRKLHLVVHGYTDRKEYLRSIDWSFLGSMKRLNDVHLRIPNETSRFGTATELLAALPKNQLEGLRITSCSWPDIFWKTEIKEEDEDVDEDDDEENDEGKDEDEEEVKVKPDLQFKIELLQGFTCLRRLNLISNDSVDDFLLQFILKNFVLLEELEVHECSKLTDVGITGKWGDTVLGVSISNLRSLKRLKIYQCRLVTQEGILNAVHLSNLKYLEYTNPHSLVTRPVVLQLVKQNPSLEEISLKFHFQEEISIVKHRELLTLLCDLRRINGRVTKMWGYYNDTCYWAHHIFGSGGGDDEET